MTLFNITLDSWAKGNAINISTIIIQSICLCVSLIILFSRIHYIYKHSKNVHTNWALLSLQLTQMLMVFCSCFYFLLHEWNYIHLWLKSNPINCTLWFCLTMSSFALTRILLFAFLMLRSSISFANTFCAIPLKISVTMVAITTFGALITIPMILTDFIPFTPYNDKGFCFRILGKTAVAASTTFHALNCVSSIGAVIIFYWKASEVHKSVKILKHDNKMSDSLKELNYEFRKHIKLGIITVVGTIIIFFIGDVMSVTMGIIFALDQTVNNVLIFIMFKENSVWYQYLFCKPQLSINQRNIINIKSNKNEATATTTNATNNTGSSHETPIDIPVSVEGTSL